MRRGLRIIATFAMLTAGAVHAGETVAPPVEARPGAPNVVLLSVDTLRADRLGSYGYPLDTTPNLDIFAEEALLFEDCVTEIPLTGPSFGAMLTSRYPRTTGATRNGLPVPDAYPTVPEFFQLAGYQTFCVQSNWTLKRRLSGLSRGFDIYDDDFHRRRWGFIKSERRADEVTEIALDWLAARDPDRPFFAWIHFSDPHAPYRHNRGYNPSGQAIWRMRQPDRVRAKYDSEVAYTDAHIGKILEALPEENTFVLFVSDHGEGLLEHDYIGHGRRVYHTEMQIPLIIRGPGIEAGRTRRPARGLDIGPTLLGLAGLDVLPGMEGVDLLNSTVSNPRERVFETYGGAVPNLPGARALMADAGPLRQAIVHDGWKLIDGGQTPQLFNIEQDPGETENLAAREPERLAKLRARLAAWNERNPHASRTDGPELSREDVEALRALGYID